MEINSFHFSYPYNFKKELKKAVNSVKEKIIYKLMGKIEEKIYDKTYNQTVLPFSCPSCGSEYSHSYNNSEIETTLKRNLSHTIKGNQVEFYYNGTLYVPINSSCSNPYCGYTEEDRDNIKLRILYFSRGRITTLRNKVKIEKIFEKIKID
ncbi:MAG: hypothetical protein ABGW69_00190 [Nanoarchaeota archaeon]